jgi:hypothetical protein
LAVMASLVSVWTAQKMVEQQEDKDQPSVYPTINIHDRIQGHSVLSNRSVDFSS